MDLELTDSTAIVTGGSRGIGKAIARELAREGVDVAIVARGRAALDATAAEIAAESGRKVLAIVADTTDDAAVRSMVDEAAGALGRLDILVNCAARPGGPREPLEDTTDEMFWEHMNTKVLGYLRCARAVAPHMRRQGAGRIVNVSGLAARSTGSTIGSMRNVAVSALTKNLADQLGPAGIGVVCVHPGLTLTERLSAENAPAPSNALGRHIDAREIAYVVTFLASSKAAAITGESIAAGGGVGRAIHY